MIDLHLHTTASDGRSAPDALVRLAADAGLRTIAITDHDTMAGSVAVAATAAGLGLTLVPGIEITAVLDGRDVHVLGYGLDGADPELAAFLAEQRGHRLDRLREIGERLASLGKPVDVEALLAAPRASEASLGRPAIARALVECGHVPDVTTAFDTLLAFGQPAFVPRCGASPAEVVAIVGRAGGIASLAHPRLTGRDDIIPSLADAGLAALEAHHSDHAPADVERYLALASELRLAVTGGSDYHGPNAGRADRLGQVTLPAEAFARLAPLLAASAARARAGVAHERA